MSKMLHRDFSQTRIEFLNTEADLGTTLVRTAETERSLHPEHAARALAKARTALQVIKGSLANPLGLNSEQVGFLAKRCRTLEAGIEGVKRSRA